MKLSALVTFNGILFIAFGIAFALYGPLMMAFFDVPELNIDSTTYWHLAAFGRMFGAALFGYGFLLLALRGAVDELSAAKRRSIAMALLLGNLLATVVSLTQQSSIWYNAAGWATSGVFAVLTVGYGAFLVTGRSKGGDATTR
jgi:hypothetical protein